MSLRSEGRPGHSPVALLLFLSCLCWAAPARAQSPRPVLRTGRTTDPIQLDGRITEAAWFTADSIDGLTEVEPVAGIRPASHTVVRVLATEREIYVGVVAWNPPGVRTTSYSKARDSEIDNEDYLGVIFDTFLDGRSGYVFVVNPNGARLDGLVSSRGEDVNSNWDAIWDVKTTRSDSGWSAEFVIPLKSLIFARGLDTWGFNFERRVQASQETSRWASASPDIKGSQTSRAGLLTGLPDFRLGIGISIRPALSGGRSKESADSAYTGVIHPSLDVTQRIGGNLLASATVNTDFAETDVDARRTNLTRFPLFFPEKRSFFLEGADIFEFGLGTGEEVMPFFSRRIGLYQGQQIPLLVGGKLNGRVNQTNVGALATVTDSYDDLVPIAGAAVMRVQQNVLQESSAGVIGTLGDPAGRDNAWTGGGDFTYQTSHFAGDKNLLIGVWALATGRDSLAGDRTAIGGKIDYPNDLWDVALTWKRVGDGFDPSLGFVPRRGVYLTSFGGAYQPRPGKWGVRQMFFEFRGNLATDLDLNWESWRIFLAPVNWQLESGDRFEANVVPQGERLKEPFEIADGVVIQPGSYGFTRYRLELETASKRPLSGQLTWWFGGFYGGTLHQVEVEAFWRPSATVNLSLSGERNIGDLPEGSFDQTLVAGRLQLNLSPQLQASSYWQYDTDSRELGTNSRIRWSFSPAGDVFLVYNHNVIDHELGGWQFGSNDLRLKVQYTVRY
jgi:hypothetical protein